MRLVSWNPFRDIDRDVARFFENAPLSFFGKNISPRVDVYDTEDKIVVKAEIPGVSKEDLNIYVDENTVRISGQTKRENEFNDENLYHSERYYGSFSRTIPLPVQVKSDEAEASYRDGLLSITLPKAEPAKNRGRKIEIQ
ncbi:heat shock protein Hsp20 [Thermoclostridium stercorarium subsp. stercorarium DSM 8532]|jgi:HSP20 family protein|uniref:Heat shock protein Hsp20 n=3 Tax=Thermoclostridium stercorarium TaxID=1510 RepID=L7VNE9_THES1|nr:Hsp20/alpha crystallin family protein [Thermoclostridium stercorarium]AGC67991.1 heat shock protein Hsp20 [Thermoclostridium stercorarium subsp. stercorarium DSM 8532]AGI39026.1 heat shock protein [Thermoclostridium stercorarium subsp. stercorarium DSM 8532]ANW98393.1 heat-shock protein Hsp20 [Thermoclostridium stercorarium subsp. thermolacticum DSM 2910]ANX00929.1 heat-shock protein Hsp20 [Thermoclostridium stercorarium subsp. leptospartum DSM 9219]UZQ86533.1 Hsp20/alpha crystallin family 